MKDKILELKTNFLEEIKSISNKEQLNDLRVKYLGKKGFVNDIMPMMKDVPAENKREMGMLVNDLKNTIENQIKEMEVSLEKQAIANEIANDE